MLAPLSPFLAPPVGPSARTILLQDRTWTAARLHLQVNTNTDNLSNLATLRCQILTTSAIWPRSHCGCSYKSIQMLTRRTRQSRPHKGTWRCGKKETARKLASERSNRELLLHDRVACVCSIAPFRRSSPHRPQRRTARGSAGRSLEFRFFSSHSGRRCRHRRRRTRT